MSTSAASTTGHLTDLARARARAESDELAAMLRYRDAEMARTEDVRPVLRRQAERSAITLEIAQATGLSEGQVHHRLAAAQRVREHTPFVWIAFRAGRVDLARVREISHAVDILQRPESHRRLDRTAPTYAESRTVPELKRWLRRFVERVEPDLALERAERARNDRRVDAFHGQDGMSVLDALLPSHVAAAIDRRLDREAKALGADDPRTLQQRRADLLAAWATCTESGEAAVHAQIAVKLPADTLTGARDGFAEAADGSWSAPAAWVLDPDLLSNPVWHRLIVDPVTQDVLAHEFVGRLAPDTLQVAVAFRDGVCQAPGCLKPADECDGDHREPWPEGSTSGENIWPLCRRHHILKGHRVLQWVLPSGRVISAEPGHREVPERSQSDVECRVARLLAAA